MICKRCVLPESRPDIYLNQDGLCNICVDFDKRRDASGAGQLLESELVKILDGYRGKGKYDCLLMCSGGKDSVMSLYYMKKRYKMNPLVFTFDHGFENDEAMLNVRNAVDILGVDWIFYKTYFMRDIFSRLIRDNPDVPICHICAIWYIQLTYDMAAKHRIPLIVAGWTKGQCDEGGDSARAFASMSRATSDFVKGTLRNIPAYRDFPASIKEALALSDKKFKCRMISPHWYLRQEQERIADILRGQLKWKAPALSYPKGSTNCLMNFVSVELAMKKYGYTHYHIEMSKLIRLGRLSREEALKALEMDFDKGLADSIIRKLTEPVKEC